MYISKVNFHYVFVDLSHFEVPLKKTEGFYLNFVKEVNCILKILFFCQCLGRQLPRPQLPRSQHLGGHCRMLTSVQRTDICLNSLDIIAALSFCCLYCISSTYKTIWRDYIIFFILHKFYLWLPSCAITTSFMATLFP